MKLTRQHNLILKAICLLDEGDLVVVHLNGDGNIEASKVLNIERLDIKVQTKKGSLWVNPKNIIEIIFKPITYSCWLNVKDWKVGISREIFP